MEQSAEVNASQCKKIGQAVKNLRLHSSFYQREFIAFKADKETKLRAYFWAVAICHQTHTLINKKDNLKGWEYLEQVFSNLAKDDSELLDPGVLAELTIEELSTKLKPLFADDNNPNHCTLDRLEERSRLLIDSGKIIKEKYDNKLTNLVTKSDGYLIKDEKGLYKLLEQFEAYADPMRKKSTILIKFAQDAGLLKIKDPENMIVAMDYHMQRVLLRMGCVEINDPELKNKLFNKEALESDEEIRTACVEALRIIGQTADYPADKMNDFFWPLGRSCCKELLLCVDKKCNKSPCTFYQVVELDNHDKCLFAEACKASQDAEYRKFWQPIVQTHYY